MEPEWRIEPMLQLSTDNISYEAATLPSETSHLKTKPLATGSLGGRNVWIMTAGYRPPPPKARAAARYTPSPLQASSNIIAGACRKHIPTATYKATYSNTKQYYHLRTPTSPPKLRLCDWECRGHASMGGTRR